MVNSFKRMFNAVSEKNNVNIWGILLARFVSFISQVDKCSSLHLLFYLVLPSLFFCST